MSQINQNIHQAFCVLCQAQTTLEPGRKACKKKKKKTTTAKQENASGTEEQEEDGVLPLLTSSILDLVSGSPACSGQSHLHLGSCGGDIPPEPGKSAETEREWMSQLYVACSLD